jgi:hypothetical protein
MDDDNKKPKRVAPENKKDAPAGESWSRRQKRKKDKLSRPCFCKDGTET